MRYLSRFRFLHKGIQNRSSRHTDRALNDYDIFFARIDITLFIRLGRITFISGHKPGCHLYAGYPHRQIMFHIFSCVNAARHNDRNMHMMRFPGFFDVRQYFLYFLIIP